MSVNEETDIRVTLQIAGQKYSAWLPGDTPDEEILNLVRETLRVAPRKPWETMRTSEYVNQAISHD